MDAAGDDLRMLGKNSRRVCASRWMVRIARIPFGFAGWDAVVQDGMFEKLFEPFGVRSTRQCLIGKMEFEHGPAVGAEFTRECLLDFTKTGRNACTGQDPLQARQCFGIAGA